jgi:hypothetical protein
MERADNARFFRDNATEPLHMAAPNTGRFTESFHAIQARVPVVFFIVQSNSKRGTQFRSIYFLNYTWHVNDLHKILKE